MRKQVDMTDARFDSVLRELEFGTPAAEDMGNLQGVLSPTTTHRRRAAVARRLRKSHRELVDRADGVGCQVVGCRIDLEMVSAALGGALDQAGHTSPTPPAPALKKIYGAS